MVNLSRPTGRRSRADLEGGSLGRGIQAVCYSSVRQQKTGRVMSEYEHRFWSKVDASGPCWEWTASVGKTGGYGKYTIPLRDGTGKSKHVYAHRHAYEILIGPVPSGMDLDHLCRVRKCVNPDHLEPVTRRENVRRGTGPTGRNMSKTSCPSGHEYDSSNTYVSPQGYRACIECRRAYDKKRRPSREGGSHHVSSRTPVL